MNELRENEVIILEKLKKMAENGNPISFSLRSFNIELNHKKWAWKNFSRKASHTAVKNLLTSLQSKGYLTLDYSDKRTTKVIIN